MSDSVYAVVNGKGLIENVVVWDGITEWSPPEGTTAVDCGDSLCQIGGTYKEGKFSPAPQAEVSKDDLIAQAEVNKNGLMDIASLKISVLQDAVDLDMATETEATQLTTWKKYRVALNRIDTSAAPDIVWPEIPA